MTNIRMIHDEPAPGDWNMAVDEALAESVARSGVPVLRFYGWSAPTLSLGYFQRAADRALHPASQNCPMVRRASGGGAILHDRELTYCLVLPNADPRARRPRGLYMVVHQSLQRHLAERDVRAELQPRTLKSDEFLCFARRAEGDMLLNSQKICGSAQRRHSGSVAQHGSILLAESPRAPELPGILELSGVNFARAALAEEWGRRLGVDLDLTPQASELTTGESEAAEILRLRKFASAAWNEKR